MIEGAILSNARFRIYDDAAEVMNAQAFPNPSWRWERNACNDLCKTLNQEAERLRGDATLVTPAKDAVDEKRLEPLGQHTSHRRTQSWPFLAESGNIGPHASPERSQLFFCHRRLGYHN
jgi:hypothetical protein